MNTKIAWLMRGLVVVAVLSLVLIIDTGNVIADSVLRFGVGFWVALGLLRLIK